MGGGAREHVQGFTANHTHRRNALEDPWVEAREDMSRIHSKPYAPQERAGGPVGGGGRGHVQGFAANHTHRRKLLEDPWVEAGEDMFRASHQTLRTAGMR